VRARFAPLFATAVVVLAALLASPWSAAPARAASAIRLVMVEEPGCRFCQKWHAEIGRGYRNTDEGRFAPLQRVRRGAPELKGLTPVVYTPTFILMRSGEEIGRVTGYPGAEYFYEELRPLLSAAGFFPGFWAKEARAAP
jgi:hypothetical protein